MKKKKKFSIISIEEYNNIMLQKVLREKKKHTKENAVKINDKTVKELIKKLIYN